MARGDDGVEAVGGPDTGGAAAGDPPGSPGTPAPRRRRPRTSRILVGVAVALVAVVLLIVVGIPDDEEPKTVSAPDPDPAVIDARLVVEGVDANRNVLRVRLTLARGSLEMPANGVTVYTDVGPNAAVPFKATDLTKEITGEVVFDQGDVGDYPFDSYRTEVSFLVAPGADAPADLSTLTTVALPINIVVLSAAPGFAVTAQPGAPVEPLSVIELGATRATATLTWVWAMMVLYWVLALAVVAVTLSILVGERIWESRHLAWLGAMIFAFAAFRNAAPGTPPIGVFFDFVSFFPAELVVALCLAALVVYMLIDPHGDLTVRRREPEPPR